VLYPNKQQTRGQIEFQVVSSEKEKTKHIFRTGRGDDPMNNAFPIQKLAPPKGGVHRNFLHVDIKDETIGVWGWVKWEPGVGWYIQAAKDAQDRPQCLKMVMKNK